MTATVTDLFCGAGGSSTGARAAGMEIVLAANHWQTAIDVHQIHHPDAAHDCADVSQVDPRRYPRTDVLLASPECTNHSQARGISRKRQDPTLWDAPDAAAERSRATMWDVLRFAEQMAYDCMVVENVVEATKWVFWATWRQGLTDLGYEVRILSHNSMHHGVPQSRDRIYVVCWRKGLKPDLELELVAWCSRCDLARPVRQAWKNGRTVGRYRQQYVWACTTCGGICEPSTEPAATIIDWALDCPRIGDRARPLATATRARILAGLQRYGWAPITTSGAGNVFEATPGNRARSVDEPLPVQQTTATTALATPPSFLFQTAHGGRVTDIEAPHPTVCASDDRQALVVRSFGFVGSGELGRFSSDPECEPLPTCVSTQRPAIVMANTTNNRPRSADEPVSTVVAGTQRHALVVPSRRNGRARPTAEALPTVAAGGTHHGLLMRNNGGGAEMVTPADEPARTLTSKGHQSLLVPYYGKGQAQPVARPVPTVPTRDHFAVVDAEAVVDDCGFRMLEPYEIAAAMAFPDGYIPRDLRKWEQVKLAGNAVTPPVMQWITGRLLQALETAAS